MPRRDAWTMEGVRQDDIELSHSATTADYDFIANARQDVERLVAEVERLQGLAAES